MGLFKRKNSPIFWMSFTVKEKQYRRSTGTQKKRVAEAIIGKVKARIIESKWFEIDEAKQHSFDEVVKKFMTEHAPMREPKTQESYRNSLVHLNPYFSGMLLSDITPKIISEYYQKRKVEGSAIASVNREFAMMSKMFTLAWKQWEWVKENPCMRVQKDAENNQVDRWLNEDEYNRLINASFGLLNGDMTDIILVALHTGMRQNEILELKRSENIDLSRKVITVSKTKNKVPKTIPMNDTIYNMLSNRSNIVSISGHVFSVDVDRIKKRTLIREFDKAIARAGITDFTFHCLRHTAATWMVQRGIDLYAVAKILGHKDIKTTMRYAHHCPDSLKGGVSAIEKFIIPHGIPAKIGVILR